jgi:hypothetical protein
MPPLRPPGREEVPTEEIPSPTEDVSALADGEVPVFPADDVDEDIPEELLPESGIEVEPLDDAHEVVEELLLPINGKVEGGEALGGDAVGEEVLPDVAKREKRKQKQAERMKAESERLRGLTTKIIKRMDEARQEAEDAEAMAQAADAWGDGSKDKSSSQANQTAKVDRYSMRYMMRAGVKYKNMMTSHQPRKDFWFEQREEYFDEELSETGGRQESWIDPTVLLAGGLIPLRNKPEFTPWEEVQMKEAEKKAKKAEKKRIRRERRALKSLKKEVKAKEVWAVENGFEMIVTVKGFMLDSVDVWAEENEMELGAIEVWAEANEVDLLVESHKDLLEVTGGDDPRFYKAKKQHRLLQLEAMVQQKLDQEGTAQSGEEPAAKSG